jgi:uncharacterized protein
MDVLLGIPALAKVLILFAAIVGLYKLRVPLWLDIFIVAALTGLWFGAGPVKTVVLTARCAVSGEALYLCSVVFLIQGISNVMEGAGVLKRLVGAFTELLGRSMRSSAALPALIGFLPMPGGAIFSAPMVETACEDGEQSPEQKSAINYWFRHIWEYWWPLYPGIILATTLFRIPMWKMLVNLPLTVAAAAGGWLFILRPSFRAERHATHEKRNGARARVVKTVRESAPIIVMIVSILGVGPLMGVFGVSGLAAKYWPVIFGVTAGLVWLAAAERIGAVRTVRMMLTRAQIPMILIASAIMSFKGVLDDSGAFASVQADLACYHVPALVVIAALPFIAGMVTGIAVGFVGTSMPIVISMLPAGVMDTNMKLAYLSLAYSAGYIGMMLSPVHLCLIVTRDYFKADLNGIYKWILIPGVIVVVAGAGLFLLYRSVF